MCVQGAAIIYRTVCPCHEGVMIFLTTDPTRTKVVQFSVCLFFLFPGLGHHFLGKWMDMGGHETYVIHTCV